MSARKLGRFAGLVFVLVALVGGPVALAQSSAAAQDNQATIQTQADLVWL